MRTLVVVPFINNIEMTTDCAKAISNTILSSDELLLIDNGSKMGNFQKVEKRFPGTIRCSDRNMAQGWNLGMDKFLGGDYDNLCMVHNDVMVQKGWLTDLKLAFDADSDCGVSFPRQCVTDNGFVVYDKSIPNGCCFLLRRKTVEKVGKFNPDYIIKPDIEYFKRVRESGLKLIVCSRSYVEHIGGMTTSSVYSLNYYAERLGDELKRIGVPKQ